MKPVTLALALSVALAAAAHAGPPYIRATLRGHPTLGGFITLATFHHGTQQAMELRGTAEGLVDGRRTSTAIRFDAVPRENGTYVVPKNWGDAGVWVLTISTDEAHGGAGVVVGVARTGRATWVVTPRTVDGLSRPATASEVDALLTALDAGRAPPELTRADLLGFAARNPKQAIFMVLLATACAWLVSRAGRTVVRLVRRSYTAVAA